MTDLRNSSKCHSGFSLIRMVNLTWQLFNLKTCKVILRFWTVMSWIGSWLSVNFRRVYLKLEWCVMVFEIIFKNRLTVSEVWSPFATCLLRGRHRVCHRAASRPWSVDREVTVTSSLILQTTGDPRDSTARRDVFTGTATFIKCVNFHRNWEAVHDV